MNDFPNRDYQNARRMYAYWLRCHGYNFREIGERLGVSASQAGSIVHAYEAAGE